MTSKLAVPVLALALSGCVLVDNPSYLELSDEHGDATSTSTSADGESTSDASETSETGGSESDASETSDACPSGTFGCPCEGDTCTNELVCEDGLCVLPTVCPDADPGVIVDFAPNEGPDADTYLGICEIDLAVEGSTLFGNLDCILGTSDFSFTITPYLIAEQPLDFLGNNMPATLLLRVDAELGVFVRIVLESGTQLWLVAASQLDSGDQDVTTYPVPLAPAGSDCVPQPEPCGASQRRALTVGDVVVFDGSVAAPAADLRVWVDEARSVCGVDSYRYALIAY